MENEKKDKIGLSTEPTKLLSILIPTYNYDCSALLVELGSQIASHTETEVIVADDCSTQQSIASSVEKMANQLGFRYIKATENHGRAVTRNTLAYAARGQYLLFMDADAMPENHELVSDYLKLIGQSDVVCGTVRSPRRCPSDRVSLRWIYDHTSEPLFEAHRRAQNPYGSFSSFCFMIRRDVFMRIRFDETFVGYGYEDTLFGHALEHEGASICHRDIGCLHLGLESNEIFLDKVRMSNRTLLYHAEQIGNASTLLRYARNMGRWHLLHPTLWLYRLTHRAIERHLIRARRPSYKLLQFYKLIHLCKLMA